MKAKNKQTSVWSAKPKCFAQVDVPVFTHSCVWSHRWAL